MSSAIVPFPERKNALQGFVGGQKLYCHTKPRVVFPNLDQKKEKGFQFDLNWNHLPAEGLKSFS